MSETPNPPFTLKPRSGCYYDEQAIQVWPENLNPGDGLLHGDKWETVLSRRYDTDTERVTVAVCTAHNEILAREIPNRDQKVVVRRIRPRRPPTEKES